MRNVQYHRTIVDRKYFRVHYSGAYALWEIDFGRIAHWELVILLGCIDKIANAVLHKPLIPKKEKWRNGVAY